MAGSRSFVPRSASRGLVVAGRRARLVKTLRLALWVLAAFVPFETRAGVSVWAETSRLGMGVSSMSEAHTGSLLVEYFKEFLDKRDVDAFRNRVAARYNEGTLGRILSGSPDVSARRAAVLSLGILGSFEQSNAVLGKALRDNDVAVRSMAEDALWAIWFRADTPEHNQMLEQVRLAISREQLDASRDAGHPADCRRTDFAEAYNQRAIVYFLQGRFAESVQDCQQRPRPQPVSHRGDRGIGEVPARPEPSSRRAEVAAPGLEASAVQQCAPREHPRARDADRVGRIAVTDSAKRVHAGARHDAGRS